LASATLASCGAGIAWSLVRPGSTALSLDTAEARTASAGPLGAGRQARPAATPAAAMATPPTAIQRVRLSRGAAAMAAVDSLVIVVILFPF
jgi:hypothetical protein